MRRPELASDAANSRGRLVAEPDSALRSPFLRDRDRIIHSTAFRRLQYKTQVFVYHEGDHYRSRLTHSLEVAQIARTLCRALGFDEDLAEAIALAHDLGHPPFGHAGEQALQAAMAEHGGFDHNAQTLKVVTRLEHRYVAFAGLNLTWESLEGIVKHNGPIAEPPGPIADYVARHDLELGAWPGPEAQVAALADDIAYNNHDIDDGLRAGLLDFPALRDLPLVGGVIAEVEALDRDRDRDRRSHECVRRLIGLMVEDLVDETERRIESSGVRTAADIRALDRAIVGFSAPMRGHLDALKAFLRQHMYRHWRVNRMTSKARRVVSDLFRLYTAEPECLPPDWSRRTDGIGQAGTARAVADFIAGMTDRYAEREHRRLFEVGLSE